MARSIRHMTDEELRTWCTSALAQIAPAPLTWGITVETADQFGELAGSYSAALQAARSELTRGVSTCFAKKTARNLLVDFLQKMIRQIQASPLVSDQMRTDLGINVRKPPTPAPIPGKAKLDSVSMDGHNWTVRAHAGLGTRGRPAHVAGISYFVYVGEEAPADPALWSFVSNTHEMKVTIPFDVALTPGTKVWATAFFRNSRDESGVAADPISTVINFGNAMLSKPMAIKKAA